MAISGGIKCFEKSRCLGADGATISASPSGDSTSSYAIDMNRETYWRSSSSTDLTTETLTITFPSTYSISRLLLLDHNWKNFTVQYLSSGVWTHFSSVTGLSGSKSNVSETAFAYDTAYYEFASVSTNQIRIQVLSTQTANQQKYLNQVIATSELGTLAGYPEVSAISMDRNARVKKTLSGKSIIQKSLETASFSLNFANYPSSSTYNVDMDVMMALHDREDPFLVWLCGGRRGTNYFRYTLRGYRLRDVYQMQVAKAFGLKYQNGIYTLGLNCQVYLEEHI